MITRVNIMRGIFLISGMVLFILFSPIYSQAGVAGSKHDMKFMGKGTDLNVCSYCHIPHNAAGDKIWSDWGNEAQLTAGPSTHIGNMCYTCHDGTATNVGQSTVFNNTLQQHKISPGSDCDMCHDPHDNTNLKFMKVLRTERSYCASCHNGTINAGGLGDHTNTGNPGNHPSTWTTTPAHNTGANCSVCHTTHTNNQGSSCYMCHAKAHGAVNYSTPQITNPILLYNNTDSAFCARCHPVSVQSTTGGMKHPANLSSSGTWEKVACETCHDPHQPDKPENPHILRNQNVDSAYCMTCHGATDTGVGPKIGHSHPTGMAFQTAPTDPSKTPAANMINDDNYNGIDYPANSDNVICESCHSVHRKGIAAPLLRMDLNGSALCLNCHQNK